MADRSTLRATLATALFSKLDLCTQQLSLDKQGHTLSNIGILIPAGPMFKMDGEKHCDFIVFKQQQKFVRRGDVERDGIDVLLKMRHANVH